MWMEKVPTFWLMRMSRYWQRQPRTGPTAIPTSKRIFIQFQHYQQSRAFYVNSLLLCYQNKITQTAMNDQPQNDDGFLSEQQYNEELIEAPPNLLEELPHHEINIVKKLQPPTEIQKQAYSLQPDMLNGWAPKIQLIQPIPLTFKNYQFDAFLDFAENRLRQQDKVKLCYLGARYESTYYAWYDKDFQFPYSHMNPPKNIQITDRYFCGQHWDAESSQYLIFDSFFESGNLDCAFKVGQYEYDLFMRVDSNTRGHLHWFNFKVKNFQEATYKFNICNFQKSKSLYSRGMKPYMKSKMEEKKDIGWHQIDTQAKYSKKVPKSFQQLQFFAEESPYRLTFKYTSHYNNDEVQFAYCIPYTFSYLQQFLKNQQNKVQDQNIFHLKKLCTSLGGLQIPQITITSQVNEQTQAFKNGRKLNKKVIIITGRCHPGETNGSWMVHGLIEFLCGNSKIANFLRQNLIFKIYPMLNPDGVVIGNYRTGLSGKDFNRQFINPQKLIFPEVYFLKQRVWKYKQLYRENVSMYLDFHGHSVKKNVFAYGPEFPLIHKFYYECRLFPKIISSKTQMFRYYSCIFKVSEFKESTARAVILRNFKIPLTYTIEASNGSYYNHENLQNTQFDEEKWKKMGEKILQGLQEYYQMIFQLQKIRKEKLSQRRKMIEKARSKKIPKKILSYVTTSNFHKAQEEYSLQSYSISDLMGSGPLKQKKYEDLFKEIKGEKQKAEEEKLSDDEISEGSSDSEGSQDDLNEKEMQKLISAIKKKTNEKQTIRSKMKKIKDKSNIRIKSMYSEAQIKRDYDDQPPINKPFQNKEKTMKTFLKRKSSLGLSPTIRKQEVIQPTKIVTFNFDVRPVDCSIRKFKTLAEEKKEQRNDYRSYTQINDRSKKQLMKSTEYSQTFRKTFMSVQKQMIRRDNYKRQIILINNQKKQKSELHIDNIQGKKIRFN